MRFLTLSVALAGALLAKCTLSHPLAIDVELTPHGAVVADSSRPSFDPDGPVGWRMIDRFRAFRFELTLEPDTDASSVSLMGDVASLAHEHKCFGWIQATSDRCVAGEVRCPKTKVTVVESRLAAAQGQLTLLPYANTKIRYHFPTFRVLSEPRYVGKTCFPTPPHACPAVMKDSIH